jgi:hypothetical protein
MYIRFVLTRFRGIGVLLLLKGCCAPGERCRNVADLAGSPDIRPEHLAEAIQYRSMDGDWWGG